jgi:hypothetical protein
MNLPKFVSASAVVLLGWLAATFVHEVPSQRYPRLDKVRASAANEAPVALPQPENPAVLPVSFSR